MFVDTTFSQDLFPPMSTAPGAINYLVPPQEKPPRKKKTALCLSGDGARIPIKAGMLKAYAESGIKHDMLFGTSSGALAGALFHQGDLALLLTLCRTIRNKDVYRMGAPWRPWSKAASFYDSAPLKALLEKIVNVAKLHDNPIPFTINATDLETSTPMTFPVQIMDAESIMRALLASASIPVAFPTVQVYHRESMADGGLTNDYCVGQAVLAGAERIILMTSLVQESRPIRNWIDALEATISAGIESQMEKEIDLAERNGCEVIVIKPTKPTGVGILDFDYKHKDELITLGYNIAKAALGCQV